MRRGLLPVFVLLALLAWGRPALPVAPAELFMLPCCPSGVTTVPALLHLPLRSGQDPVPVVLVTGPGSIEALSARGEDTLGHSAAWQVVSIPQLPGEIHAYGDGAVLVPRARLGPTSGDSALVRVWDAYPIEGGTMRLCLVDRLASDPSGRVLVLVTVASSGAEADPSPLFWKRPIPSEDRPGPCAQ